MVKDSPEKERSQKPGESSDSKYKGVRKRKWGKWVSEIRLPNSRERIWLGSYDSAEKAARAFDAALFCLRGRTAKFNFPDNPPNISNGRSLTPSEIQVVAHQFANSGSDPPRSSSDNSMYELQTESQSQSQSPSLSPSPSVMSDGGGAIMENELNTGGSYLDLLTSSNMGSGNYASDYGIFPGFDDLSNDYYVPSIPSVDYGEENYDGSFNQGSFLWNF